MAPEITMRELIILVLCFVLYVVSVEIYETRINVTRQGALEVQEQSIVYQPAQPPASDDGATVVTGMEGE